MDHPTIMEIYEAMGSRIMVLFVFAFGGLGWALVYRLWKHLENVNKKFPNEKTFNWIIGDEK
jgi:hypothetical protein